MFEILVYLFENYSHTECCPEPAQLAIKLSAAGFEDEEINEALEWLSGLQRVASARPCVAAQSRSLRCYGNAEAARLDVDCRSFLLFLENAGVVDAVTREMIIDRAMALAQPAFSLAKLKVIVLMVLWSQRQLTDSLVLEELLSAKAEHRIH